MYTFVVASTFRHRGVNIFHICAWLWSSITLSLCRCREANKLLRAQLCKYCAVQTVGFKFILKSIFLPRHKCAQRSTSLNWLARVWWLSALRRWGEDEWRATSTRPSPAHSPASPPGSGAGTSWRSTRWVSQEILPQDSFKRYITRL